MTYLVWDWNGTLLDDTTAALGALNAMLARRGKRPISPGFYRERFAFPVRHFYEECGFELEREDWDAIAVEYHDSYAAEERALMRGAVAALERAKSLGAGQSLLSALRQDKLEQDVARFGADGFFEFVRGTDNLDGASKEDAARRLAQSIRAAHPAQAPDLVFIGDAIHDKEVADALNARCVLFGGGSHAASRLAPLAPVGETLDEVIDIAFGLKRKQTTA